MGERAQQPVSGEEIDRLANLSDAEVANEARRIDDVQQRALLIRRVRARQREFKKNLKKAEADEKKLPHNTAAEKDAGDDIPKHNKVQYDDESIELESSEAHTKGEVKAEDASASVARTKTTTTTQGEQSDVAESSVKGSAGLSGASLGGERSKEHKTGEGADEVADKRTGSADASIDWEKGEGEVKGGYAKETKHGDQVDKRGGEASVGYKDGHVEVGGGYGAEKKTVDEHGDVKSASSVDVKAHVSSEGAGGDLSASSTNEHGTKLSGGAGGEVNWKEGTGSVHATGGLTGKDGKEAHLSAHAGIEVIADAPVQVGDHWTVHYKIVRTIGGGAGGGVGKENKAGIDVGGKSETYEMGTRSFKDEKEAKEFKEHAKEKIGEAPSPDTVDGAMALEVGESRGKGSALGGSLGGTGSFEGAKMGVSGHAESSDELEIKRVSETLFDVTYKHQSGEGADASLGGGPLTTGRGASGEEHAGLTVRFDLGTKEGRRAFEQFQKDHKKPASGGALRSTQGGKSDESHDGTKIKGLGAASYGSHTGEDKVVDDKGSHETFTGGQSHSVNPTWVGRHLGDDKVSSNVEVEAKVENGRDDGFTVTGNVGGESGKYNRGKMQALSSGLVEHENWDESKVKSSGDWSMSADIDKKTMQSLESHSDRFKGKSKDEQMRALGEWVADDGSKAVQSIERWSGKALDWDLELKGDKNFPGRAGRLELEARVHKLSTELAHAPGSAAAVAGQIDGEVAALEERRKAVHSSDKYTDLPDGLRQQQLRLIDQQIAAFESLRHRALIEGTKNKPGESANQIAAREAKAAGGQGGAGAAGPGNEGPLGKLRDDIALADAAIAGYQKQNAEAIAAMVQALKHVDWSKRSAAGIATNGNEKTTQASAIDATQRVAYARLDEERAALMKNAANPQAAAPIAEKLLGELNAQTLKAGEAATLLYDAARRQILVTKPAGFAGHAEFWQEVRESMDGDDYAEDDDVADSVSAAVDDDPEPPPAHVSMALPKR
jgi:hypothetical protein